MKQILLLVALIANQAFSQSFTEKELPTKMDEVTVFLQGAQVNRSGKLLIPSGKSVLVVKSLSPYLDEKSIQVKGEGTFTILSVNHKLNFIDQLKKDSGIDSLNRLSEKLELEIANINARQEILKEKQSLLNENKNLGGYNSGASLVELRQAIDFYKKELTGIKSEEIKNKNRIEELGRLNSQYQNQISELNNQKDQPTSEIEIRVESKVKTEGRFQISYLVNNAGWFPNYDIRVEDIENPIQLNYKASVYQNTGEDWENVKLRFSNSDPNQSGVAPQLNTWYLNYSRNTVYKNMNPGLASNSVGNVSGIVLDETGNPIPGVNVLIKGTTIGTVTDVNGHYSLTLPNDVSQIMFSFIGYVSNEVAVTSSRQDVQLVPDLTQLEEVDVTGYLQGRTAGVQVRGASSLYGSRSVKTEIITTTTIENQTTVEFEIPMPYSIKSNGEKLSVDLKQYEIPALYKYYAVPKLDKDAFLMARIFEWDQYNLLEGEANLYFEDAYVGRTILDAKSLVDTLNISLGRDKNIVIGRTKIDDYTKRKALGTNMIETRGFEILARNKKSQAIDITIFDQIPVSVASDITITPEKLSDGKWTEATGMVTWELNIPAKQQTKLELGYEVKYPKREKVLLE